jgi:RNA polymerase sigma-70 factor (ECF subfamily)
MDELSDESLMLRYANGDASAFETLYARHKDALYRFVRRQCGDPDIAFELAHDIWLKLIAARRRYRPRAGFTTYLFTVARNRLIDYHRTQARRLPGTGVTSNLINVEDLPTSQDDEPDALADVRALVDRSLELVQALPQDQRQIVLLYVEGLSMTEIGAITQFPAETARSRLRRALARLRQGLDELGT